MWLSIVLVEIRKTHVRQTGSGFNFHHYFFEKIAWISSISKMVTDAAMESMEIEYETTPGLSISTMTFDLGWSWTVVVQGHQNCTSNVSKMVTDTMVVSIKVEYEITHGLSIRSVTFDLGWTWTVLDLGHRTSATNISNNVRDTMLDTIEGR